MSREEEEKETFGVLLGWKADPAGENVSLLLQSSSKVVQDDADVREFRYFMSKQQAVQLGNFLYRIAGETAPIKPKRGLIDRLMGG